MAATRVTIRGACKLLGASSITLRNLLGQELGSSDKHWNMIALSPLAHSLWGRGLFAFKCLGVIHEEPLATIQLQFRWMAHQSKSPNPYREINLEDSEAVAQDIARYAEITSKPSSKEGVVGLTNINTSRGVFSGEVFEIKMPYEEALKMNEMLGLQWAMISLLALSGAAGSPELLREPDRPAAGASQTQTQYLPDDSKHVQQERLPRSPSRHTTAQDFPTLTQRPVSQPQRPVLSPVRVSRYPSPEKQGALRSPTLEGPTLSKSPMSPGRFEENMPPWEFNPAH